MFDISIRTNIKQVSKNLSALAMKQLPYAQAVAVTSLAKRVAAAEKENIKDVFPTATPFTINSIGMRSATKNRPVAIVYVKDIAAHYLLPFEDGGVHFLGSKKGLLKPIAQAVNQYGNLPRATLARLKGKSDVFIGTVTFKKSGQTVSGVWQRPQYGECGISRGPGDKNYHSKGRGGALKGSKGDTSNLIGGVRTGLKLLIRFSDPQVVKQSLRWGSRAQATVKAWWGKDFGAAMAKAVSSAK